MLRPPMIFLSACVSNFEPQMLICILDVYCDYILCFLQVKMAKPQVNSQDRQQGGTTGGGGATGSRSSGLTGAGSRGPGEAAQHTQCGAQGNSWHPGAFMLCLGRYQGEGLAGSRMPNPWYMTLDGRGQCSTFERNLALCLLCTFKTTIQVIYEICMGWCPTRMGWQ